MLSYLVVLLYILVEINDEMCSNYLPGYTWCLPDL